MTTSTDNNLINIVGKYQCINESEKDSCNSITPFSKLKLYKNNPSTNELYTPLEREQKLLQYKNMCNISGNSVTKCCDKHDINLKRIYETLPNEEKKKYGKLKKINLGNNEIQYKVCKDNNCRGYRIPDAYELCKLSNANIDANGNAKNLTPDCITGRCENEFMPFIINKEDYNTDYLDDQHIIRFIKEDDVENLKISLKKYNYQNKILSYGFPGNTVLHECIYQNANKCIEFILKYIKEYDLELKNKSGNTPLQIACLKGNTKCVNRLMQLGGNIHTKNKYDESPLHSAIRKNATDVINLLLLNNVSREDKNKLGQSPLHVAALTPKKNLNLIKLLIKYGLDILTKDNDNNNILKNLNKQPKNSINNEINTYLTQVLYQIYKNNENKYIEILDKYPEFRPYEYVDEEIEEEDELNIQNIDEESLIDNNGVSIVYDDILSNSNLYRNKEQKAEKILPEKYNKNIIESFENKTKNYNNNYKKLCIYYGLFVIFCVFLFYINI